MFCGIILMATEHLLVQCNGKCFSHQLEFTALSWVFRNFPRAYGSQIWV